MKSEESLNKKVIKGGIWMFSLRVMERGLDFIRLIVLAKLLAPSDFGLFGIALLTISILETFSHTGFQDALIQKKENISNYLDTAWTISVIRGIVLFVLLFLLAPYMGLFFNSSEASLIIRLIGVLLLLRGFNNIGILYFQKELEFKRQFIFQLSATLANFIVAVSVALILKNVWALVWGMLAGGVTGLIASYFVHPYRPKLVFDLEKLKELFSFGKWVFGSTILIFLITQGDDIFVGKLLGVTALGFYLMAYRISNIPATEITRVISQVTFPAYSKMQDNLPRLREAYSRVLQLTTFLSFPIAGLIYILAPDFTKIFLDDKWMPMVPAMQMLCIFGATRSFGATTSPVFHGIGRPDILTKLAVFQLILMAALIYPLTNNFGIYGTAIAVVVPNFITQILAGIQMKKIINFDVLEFIENIFYPLISCGVMIIVLSSISNIWGRPDIFTFSSILLLGLSIYLGVSYLFQKILSYGAIKNLSQLLRIK